MIYAIEAVGLDRVKFGKARNPEARFKVLSTGSPVPLELIITVPWPDFYEGVIHRAFAEERITGEWFMATKRVERFCHVMSGPDLTDSERFTKSMSFIDRLCGKGHYGLCPSATVKRASKGEVQKTVAVKPDVKLFKQSLSEMARDVLKETHTPLTPAQRQKAYRERGGDELRERERLRMAAKRKEW